MKNILHINLIGGRTGAAGLIQSIISGLPKEQYHSSQLVGYNFGDSKRNIHSLYKANNTWFYKNFLYKGWVGLNFLFEIMTPGHLTYKTLVQKKEYKKADIIHLHSIQGGYFNWKDLTKISKEKKIIMTLHDDRILSGNDTNNNLFPYKTRKQYLKRKDIFKTLKIAYVGVSKWMSNKLLQDEIKGKNSVITIYNGINANLFKRADKQQARKEFGLPENTTIVISIAGSGNKSSLKGLSYVKDIAKTFEQNKNILFLTVGNHKYKTYKNIQELPFISKDRMALLFSAADIFLYPTLADSFGLVVAESLSIGCPIVTFDVGGVPEIATHKVNSYIANFKDKKDLQNGFSRMLKNKDKLNVTLDEKFILTTMVEGYKKLYESI